MVTYNGKNIDKIMLDIKLMMVTKGIKQTEIALKTGWSAQAISNLLSGRQDNITLNTLYTLVDAIGCSLDISIMTKAIDTDKLVED